MWFVVIVPQSPNLEVFRIKQLATLHRYDMTVAKKNVEP